MSAILVTNATAIIQNILHYYTDLLYIRIVELLRIKTTATNIISYTNNVLIFQTLFQTSVITVAIQLNK